MIASASSAVIVGVAGASVSVVVVLSPGADIAVGVPIPTMRAPAIALPAKAAATRRQPFCDVIEPPIWLYPSALPACALSLTVCKDPQHGLRPPHPRSRCGPPL